jgi:hypothetical protein
MMPDVLRLNYTPVRNQLNQEFPRPFLTLTLERAGRTQVVSGLVDTGADVNVMPYHIGLALGGEWEGRLVLPRLSGNLKDAEARALLVRATIGKFEPVDLAFAWVETQQAPLLLGHINFFQHFKVCFDYASDIFEVSQN